MKHLSRYFGGLVILFALFVAGFFFFLAGVLLWEFIKSNPLACGWLVSLSLLAYSFGCLFEWASKELDK